MTPPKPKRRTLLETAIESVAVFVSKMHRSNKAFSFVEIWQLGYRTAKREEHLAWKRVEAGLTAYARTGKRGKQK